MIVVFSFKLVICPKCWAWEWSQGPGDMVYVPLNVALLWRFGMPWVESSMLGIVKR